MNDLESTLDGLAADAPIDRENWDDVRARSRPSRTRLVALASLIALTAIVLAIPALGVGGRLANLFDGESVSPRELSSKDLHALSAVTKHRASPSSIVASRKADLAALGATDVRAIAEREGRVYFVIDNADGTRCYAMGFASNADRFGQIHCPVSPVFPTAELPILDESIFGRGDPISTAPRPVNVLVVKRLEGFAADGVASVGIRLESGSLESVTEVKDNVYIRLTGLPKEPVREIVALDANGKVLYSKCLLKGGGC